MSGADRYQEAYQHIADFAKSGDPNDLKLAEVQATLALAAATVLPLVVQHMGDTAAITDWARSIAPDITAPDRPEHWPPQPGQIWADRLKRCWACLADRTLAGLAFPADDTAEEIWRTYGPMTFVRSNDIEEETVPF